MVDIKVIELDQEDMAIHLRDMDNRRTSSQTQSLGAKLMSYIKTTTTVWIQWTATTSTRIWLSRSLCWKLSSSCPSRTKSPQHSTDEYQQQPPPPQQPPAGNWAYSQQPQNYGGGPPPPPPQQMQSFGTGAPSGYSFQYSACTGRRKALLIGINYFGQKGQLRGCINDVKNMSTYLNNHFGYKREDMVRFASICIHVVVC